MNSKNYNTFTNELRTRFGCRVQRISLDAGFSCPNRDGSIGLGGCSFCNERGSAAVGLSVELPMIEQLVESKEYLRRKFKAEKFLAYFQAYSNTYASVENLKYIYNTALHDDEVVGLIIGTRPDCLPDPVLDLLAEINQKSYLWIELGMQTMHDRTLQTINRGHDHDCLINAVKYCKIRGIRICLHVILGLPGESYQDMLDSILEVNRLDVDGIKFHHLHILKDSQFDKDYRNGKIHLLERDDYVDLVCNLIEHLKPGILIHRLMGDGRSELIAPDWSRRKLEVLNAIDAELNRRGSRQGCRLSEYM